MYGCYWRMPKALWDGMRNGCHDADKCPSDIEVELTVMIILMIITDHLENHTKAIRHTGKPFDYSQHWHSSWKPTGNINLKYKWQPQIHVPNPQFQNQWRLWTPRNSRCSVAFSLRSFHSVSDSVSALTSPWVYTPVINKNESDEPVVQFKSPAGFMSVCNL